MRRLIGLGTGCLVVLLVGISARADAAEGSILRKMRHVAANRPLTSIAAIQTCAPLVVGPLTNGAAVYTDHPDVSVEGVAIFGGYEDKTSHPREGAAAKRLVVRGFAIFGGVEVKN